MENTKPKLQTIQKICDTAIACDMALGFEPEIEVPSKWSVLDRYIKSGFNFISLAIAGEFTSVETTIRYIARHKQKFSQQPKKFTIARTCDDIVNAKKNSQLALGLWLQGTAPFATDLAMVDLYYEIGIRTALLCYNTKNTIGDGCTEKTDAGISNFGINLIREMNRVGMLIDCSHAGYQTTMDVMNISDAPIIFSHSNVTKIHEHPRNINDKQIIECANTGGMIGINGANQLLGCDEPSASKFVEHIDYIAQLVGVDHVGIGLDLVYFHEILDDFFEKHSDTYPKDYLKGKKPSRTIKSLQPEQLNDIIEALLLKGYKDNDIMKILGGNYLRVVRQVWKSNRVSDCDSFGQFQLNAEG